MNQFLKKALVLFAVISSTSVFSQDQENLFNPKFTLGSGLYTLTGDIQSESSGLLNGSRVGFNAGMKFELSDNIDVSLLVIKTAFSAENNNNESFSSDLDGFGLHFDYTLSQLFKKSKISPLFSLGVQSLGASTIIDDVKKDRSSVILLPLGLGLRMDITERLQFDVAMVFGIGISDIDMSNEGNADSYKSVNFTVHYDLFTPKQKENTYFDDSYYVDVDFAKLEAEDEDSDLVADVDDFCPKTPIGVKVDDNGCPLDDDKDGIPNYLDQQKKSVEGSIVDEKGVQLTDEKYQSMYSDYETASREYAHFYNENEIKRENYKTIDEYLIAKANAFNKAYHQGEDFDNTVNGLKYKVKIGAFSDGVPANVINKYLSLDDLESIPQDDGMVIYAVGSYDSWGDAQGRKYDLEDKGFGEMDILVDNNGEISNYVPPAPVSVIDEEEVVVVVEEIENINEEETVISSNETTYRIQIGAFPKKISDRVFDGVDDVVSFSGNDGLVRYMAGSFTEYKDAINYQAQMKARGFVDAFIVTYKNGERISLNVAIKTERTSAKSEVVVVQKITKPNIKFMVQILVAKKSLSAEDLAKMGKLGNIEKEAEGEEMHRYFTGSYTSLEDANVRLEEAILAGYTDAFVFAKLEGERITIEQAIELLK